jgi:high-affinity iron transporter
MRRVWSSSRSRGRGIALGVALAAVAVAFGGLIASARGGSAAGPQDITVSDSACGPNFVAPPTGHSVLTFANTSTHTTYSIDLIGSDQVSVYGEIETLAPGTNDTMDAVLAPGRYSLECESYGGGSLSSPAVEVRGPAVATTHEYTPVSSDQMHLASLAYQKRLLPKLALLQRDTDALTRAIVARKLGAARTLWLPAHLDYARLGAAYGTFGALDGDIDGRPSALPLGVRDRHFQGFLRLEYGLWHGQPASELRPVAEALDGSVHTLVRQFPHMTMDENDLSLRAHEILENSLQFELTGQTDEGSHTNLATVWANVQGTQVDFGALAPLLRLSSPALTSTAETGLAHLATTFRAYRRPDGTWRSLQSLSTAERERLDGATSALLERLSQVPDRLEIPPRPPAGDDDQSQSHD